jgi:hypothetical protein
MREEFPMKVIGFEEHYGLPVIFEAAMKASDPYSLVMESMRKAGRFPTGFLRCRSLWATTSKYWLGPPGGWITESVLLGVALRNLVSNAVKYTEPGGP